jgi:hypothetical protein
VRRFTFLRRTATCKLAMLCSKYNNFVRIVEHLLNALERHMLVSYAAARLVQCSNRLEYAVLRIAT